MENNGKLTNNKVSDSVVKNSSLEKPKHGAAQQSALDGKAFKKQKFNRRPHNNKIVDEHKIKHNDLNWYTKNQDIVIPYTKIPFQTVMGRPIQWLDGTLGQKPISFVIFPWIPCYGTGRIADYNDAINIVGLNLWTFMRSKNSRTSTDYEYQDLLMYLIAVENLNCFMDHLHMVWRLLKSYSFVQRDLPIALLEGIGVKYNPDNDIMALNDFYGAVKMLEAKCKTFAVPKGWSFYDRHRYLNSNIFLDDATRTSQLFVFNQEAYFKWDPDIETGSRLTLLSVQGQYLESLITLGNELINALINDTDVANMQSDILRAFGDAGMQSFDTITEDETVQAVFSPEICAQISNFHGLPIIYEGTHECILRDNNVSTWFRNFDNSDYPQEYFPTFKPIVSSITQSDRGILQYTHFNPMPVCTVVHGTTDVISAAGYDVAELMYDRGILMNSITNEASPDYVIESTRCVNTWRKYNGSTCYLESAGSEIYGMPFMGPYYRTRAEGFSEGYHDFVFIPHCQSSLLINMGTTPIAEDASHISKMDLAIGLLQLNYHIPLCGFQVFYQFSNDILSVQAVSASVGKRIDSYSIVEPQLISKLNDGIRTNMFKLDDMGMKNI